MTNLTYRSAVRWARDRVARRALALGAALALVGCSLDLDNPNAPTEQEVVSSRDGVVALAVGMQGTYAGLIDDYMVVNSLVTDEWGTTTRALVSYRTLLTGESFDPSYAVFYDPWAGSYRVIKEANTLIDGVDNVDLGAGFKAGVVSLAKLFKAMAYGELIMNYEEVPIDVSVEGPVPRPRAEVLDTILVLLDEARDTVENRSATELSGFNAQALAPGFDLLNTIDAMTARYALIAASERTGTEAATLYNKAIAAAGRVDQDVLSEFRFPPPTRNPIENLAVQANYVAGLRSFATEAEPGDKRPAYWLQTGATPIVGNPDSLLLPLNKYSTPNEPFPVYLPDEMTLIQAEAYTRLGGAANFATAAGLVNAVRTDNTAQVNEPIAGLDALPSTSLDTQDELLAEIARQRRYELYEQGLRWEDTRRFGAALTTEPTFPFLPIPQQECLANPSNPCA